MVSTASVGVERVIYGIGPLVMRLRFPPVSMTYYSGVGKCQARNIQICGLTRTNPNFGSRKLADGGICSQIYSLPRHVCKSLHSRIDPRKACPLVPDEFSCVFNGFLLAPLLPYSMFCIILA